MIAPSDVYPCADGKFIAVSPTGQQFWEKFCDAIDRPDIAGGHALQPSQEPHRQCRGAHRAARRRSAPTSPRSGRSASSPSECRRARQRVAEAVAQPLAGLRQHGRGAGPIPAAPAALKFLGNPFKYGEAGRSSYPPRRGAETRAVLAARLRIRHATIDQLITDNVDLSRRQPMTRPSDIKPREGDQPAALYKDWTVGAGVSAAALHRSRPTSCANTRRWSTPIRPTT